MIVESFVTRGEILTVKPEDTLADVARRMWRRGVGSAVILSGEEVGIITERDILGAVAEGAEPASAKVRAHMTEKAVTVDLGWYVKDAARTMVEHGFRHLIVLDEDGGVAGMISIRDMMRAMLEERKRTLAG